MQHALTFKNLGTIMKQSGYKIEAKIASNCSIQNLGQPNPLNPKIIAKAKKVGSKI